jgi:hypothetical protein
MKEVQKYGFEFDIGYVSGICRRNGLDGSRRTRNVLIGTLNHGSYIEEIEELHL